MTRRPCSFSVLFARARTHLGAGFALVLLAMPTAVWSTESDRQVWFNVTAIGRIGNADPGPSRWRYWLEGQMRFNDDAERNFQNILRPAVGLDLTPRVSAWLGTAWIGTETATGHRHEHRPWQQLIWIPEREPVGFSTQVRPRLEQRRLEGSGDTGWRFRQFLRGIRRLEGTAWSLVWQEEVFLNLNRTDYGARGGLDQNRLFLGVAYHATPVARFEIGYLNQFVNGRGRADAMNHILGLTLFLVP